MVPGRVYNQTIDASWRKNDVDESLNRCQHMHDQATRLCLL